MSYKDLVTCPITKSIFMDPVTISSGITYEREAISEWLSYNSNCPITRKHIYENSRLVETNVMIKTLVERMLNDGLISKQEIYKKREFNIHLLSKNKSLSASDIFSEVSSWMLKPNDLYSIFTRFPSCRNEPDIFFRHMYDCLEVFDTYTFMLLFDLLYYVKNHREFLSRMKSDFKIKEFTFEMLINPYINSCISIEGVFPIFLEFFGDIYLNTLNSLSTKFIQRIMYESLHYFLNGKLVVINYFMTNFPNIFTFEILKKIVFFFEGHRKLNFNDVDFIRRMCRIDSEFKFMIMEHPIFYHVLNKYNRNKKIFFFIANNILSYDTEDRDNDDEDFLVSDEFCGDNEYEQLLNFNAIMNIDKSYKSEQHAQEYVDICVIHEQDNTDRINKCARINRNSRKRGSKKDKK